MEKPTCPDELRNELVIVDLTTQGSSEGPSVTSLEQGLTLAAKYLSSSVKPSTLTQVIIFILIHLKTDLI